MRQRKFFTILRAIWPHSNHVPIRELSCKKDHVIEMVNKICSDTMLYHKGSNSIHAANLTGPNMTSASKVKHWDLAPIRWLKRHTDASKILITNTTSISYVCRDNTDCIQLAYGVKIGDYPISIGGDTRDSESTQEDHPGKLSNIIIESDSLIEIQDMYRNAKPPSQISNFIIDIIIQAKALKLIRWHKIAKRVQIYPKT